MACGRFGEDETNGNYIEVSGPVSEIEVLDACKRLLQPESIEQPDHCPPLITLEDGRTVVFVDVAPEPGGPTVLAVGRLDGDDDARARTAENICRTLSSQTPWRLVCSADDGLGPEGARWAC